MHDLLGLDHSVLDSGIDLFNFRFILRDLYFQFLNSDFQFFDLGLKGIDFTLQAGRLVGIFFRQGNSFISVALSIGDLVFDVL